MPAFGTTSRERLNTCDKRLRKVFEAVVKMFDCSILEGRREWSRQQELLDAVPPKTTLGPGLSKHNMPLDWDAPEESFRSKAVDAAPYPIDWDDSKRFVYFAGLVIATGTAMGVKIRWGGNWDMDQTIIDDQNFDDLPHFEIVE